MLILSIQIGQNVMFWDARLEDSWHGYGDWYLIIHNAYNAPYYNIYSKITCSFMSQLINCSLGEET